MVAVETEAQSRHLPRATQLVTGRTERDTTSVVLRPLPLWHTAIVLKEEQEISLNMNNFYNMENKAKKCI